MFERSKISTNTDWYVAVVVRAIASVAQPAATPNEFENCIH